MIDLDQAGRGLRSTRILPPPPDLRWLIEYFWIQTYDGLRERGASWRIVPDVNPHVIYARTIDDGAPDRSVGSGRLAIVGPREVHIDIDISRRLFTAGARLRPGALPLLTGVPAVELANRSVRVDDLFGGAGHRALERAAKGTGPASAIPAIGELLRALVPITGDIEPRVRHAVRLLRNLPSSLSVGGAARELGIGGRTLRLLARTQIGLSPKRIARVFRAQGALTLALREPTGRWARIAVRVGYHDQSHLIRDFRSLLGETPERFLARGLAPR